MDVGRLERTRVHLGPGPVLWILHSYDNKLGTIGIQDCTYCNIETEEIRRFKEERGQRGPVRLVLKG